MVSSKFLTAFSDHRLADHPESHLSPTNFERRPFVSSGTHAHSRGFGYVRVEREKDRESARALKINVRNTALVAYREYLCAYAARFGVLRDVRFETEVVSIVRDAAGWAVTVRDSAGTTTTEHYFAVAVCSGLHTHPRPASRERQRRRRRATLRTGCAYADTLCEERRVYVCLSSSRE